MAQRVSRKVLDLSGGLNTEAHPLQFPENSTIDEENFTIAPDKSRERRLGMEYESGYSTASQTLDTQDVVTTYYWKDVNDDADTDFIVVQIGETLHFYKDADAVSANKKSFTLDLTNYKAGSATTAQVAGARLSMSAARGHLLCTSKYVEPFYVEYDSGGDTISVNDIELKERDFQGIEDGLAPDTTPDELSDEHKYNLYNQGWVPANWAQYYTDTGTYPANSFIGKFVNRMTRDDTTSSDITFLEVYDSSWVDSQIWGSGWAPRGRVIIDPFDTTESYVSSSALAIESFTYTHGTTTVVLTITGHGITHPATITITGNGFSYENSANEPFVSTLNGDYSTTATTANTITFTKTISGFDAWLNQYIKKGQVANNSDTISNPNGRTVSVRPEFVEFFLGRAVWAGTPDRKLSKRIYISQVVERDEQYGDCYQAADPTSQHISDPIASDGMVVIIPEMGHVTGLRAMEMNLLVFADNGVWEIAPPQDGIFGPLGYRVRKITDTPCIGPGTIVKAEGLLFYCSGEGIYVIRPDERTGVLFSQDIGRRNVLSKWRDIPDEEKEKVVGAYDAVGKTVVWLYNDAAQTRYIYDHSLNFSLLHRAWTVYSYPSTDVYLSGIVRREVYDDEVQMLKYLTFVDGTSMTFSDLNDTNFEDWATYKAANPSSTTTGVDAAGYMTMGYDFLDEPIFDKVGPVTCVGFFKTTETGWEASGTDTVLSNPSGCDLEYRWDWGTSSDTNKLYTYSDLYRLNTPIVSGDAGDTFSWPAVTAHQTRLYGAGRALQMKLSTQAGEDCKFLGLHLLYQARMNP